MMVIIVLLLIFITIELWAIGNILMKILKKLDKSISEKAENKIIIPKENENFTE